MNWSQALDYCQTRFDNYHNDDNDDDGGGGGSGDAGAGDEGANDDDDGQGWLLGRVDLS